MKTPPFHDHHKSTIQQITQFTEDSTPTCFELLNCFTLSEHLPFYIIVTNQYYISNIAILFNSYLRMFHDHHLLVIYSNTIWTFIIVNHCNNINHDTWTLLAGFTNNRTKQHSHLLFMYNPFRQLQ